MPPRNWTLRIEDMIEAIERIQKYIYGMNYEQFSLDTKTIDAVVRNFEILGEAAGHVPVEVQKKYPELPWSKIKGMRNLLSHEYFGISDSILWTTAVSDLAPLLPILKSIHEEIP